MASLHESVVQTFVSSQVRAGPATQAPAAQVSPCVQNRPSSQGSVLFTLLHVSAASSQSDQQPAALTVCDGNTYYLSQSDYTAVQAAIANHSVVQLNAGPDGSAPQDAAIVCLIQAAP